MAQRKSARKTVRRKGARKAQPAPRGRTAAFFSYTIGELPDRHYVRKEIVVATGFLAVALFVAAFALDRFITRSGSPFIAAVISAVLVDITNNDRAASNLDGLTVNPLLVAAAQAKADHMAKYGYFAHNSPDGKDPWYWFKQAGYDYMYAGENLAMDFSESADVARAWMNSPSHRDNILSDKYTEIGIATAQGMYGGRPTLYVVQMFGTPRKEEQLTETGALKPEIAAQPTPEQTHAAQETARSLAAGPMVDEAVLGERVEGTDDMTPAPEGKKPTAVAESIPVLTSEDVPWWAFLLTMPKTTLRYAYLSIGLMVLLGLFLDLGLELRWHHMRHAMRAGILIATMSMLFVVADWAFFAEPVLALAWAFFG